MMRTALALALLLAAAAPALAAPSVVCTDGDSTSVTIVRGTGGNTLPKRADVSVAERNWTTDPNVSGPREIRVAQAFEDADQMLLDLADGAANTLIRLRLYKAAATATSVVGGGTLWVRGVGAYALTCSGL